MPRLTQVAGIGKASGEISFTEPSLLFSSGTQPNATVSEGSTVEAYFNIYDGAPQEGETVSYTITLNPGITADDISIPLSGTCPVTINQFNRGVFNLNFGITEDLTTEGSETLRVTFVYNYTSPLTGSRQTTLAYELTISDTSTTPVGATYVLNRSASSVNEGDVFTIELVTANVAAGTNVPYTITGVTSADIANASLTGSFVVGTTDTLSVEVTADATTEQPETFNIALDNGEDSITVLINDTSRDPTYTLVAGSATVNEGTSFSVTLNTTDLADNTSVDYTITGVSSADINNASLTGSFVVQNNTASITIDVTADQSLAEGDETFTLALDNGEDDVSVTITDSSVDTTPTYLNLTLQSASTVNEGSAVTFRITGRQIPTNTTVDVSCVSVSGTIAANDFNPASLTKTVTWTGAPHPTSQTQDFTITLAADEITEGAESFKVVLAETDSGGNSTGALESPTVSIGDTSLTPVTGQIEYDGLTNGNQNLQSFTVPDGVTSISMLCIGGGGGGGGCGNTYSGGGGGGGGLAYANNVSVTPGETLTVRVGGAGQAGSRDGNGGTGGQSSVFRGPNPLCSVNGGSGGTSQNTGGVGGGTSGTGTRYAGGAGGTGQTFSRGGGGGGAAGYAGVGGAGQNGNNSAAGGNGSGGGGGGAGAVSSQQPGRSGGGGVGNKGQGTNGVGGLIYQDGGGGSGGQIGQDGIGGEYGGGGSGTHRTGNSSQGAGQRGGIGSVRMIWPGTSRQFPSTRTANENVVIGTYDNLTASRTSIAESLTSNIGSANTVTFTLTTTDVPQGTTIGYSFVTVSGQSPVSTSDFINRDTLFTVGSNGQATVSMTATADFLTEGAEAFRIQLAETDSLGFESDGLQSPVISVTDDYPATVYNSISLNKTSYDEGDTVTISVDYDNNTDAQITVGYTISGVNSSDVSQTSGTLTLVGGVTYEGSPYAGQKTQILADTTTEGNETMTITLNATDSNGNATNGRSASATIVDTSLTPRVPGSSLYGIIDQETNQTQVNNGQGGTFRTTGQSYGQYALDMTDDYVIGGSEYVSLYGDARSSAGMAMIWSRTTRNPIVLLQNPLSYEGYIDSDNGIHQARFGNAVGLGSDSTYDYAVVAAPYHYDTNGYTPKIFVFRTTNGFVTTSLYKTITLPKTTQARVINQWKMSVHKNWCVIGDDSSANSNTGNIYYFDISASGSSYSTGPTISTERMGGHVDWSPDNSEFIGGAPQWASTQGSTTYNETGLSKVYYRSNGALKRQVLGTSYAGTATNRTRFRFGQGVGFTENNYLIASCGDDYNSLTNQGRIRIFRQSNNGLTGTVNAPAALATAGNGGGDTVQYMKANKSGHFVVNWSTIDGNSDTYGDTLGQRICIYNEAGTLLTSYNSPGQTTWTRKNGSETTWTLQWRQTPAISESYVAIAAANPGNGPTRIYIY